MPDQSNFSQKWTSDCDGKGVKVEVGLYQQADFIDAFDSPLLTTESIDWIEIPTNDVRVTVAKGGGSARKRTAKVQFPTEWGGDSPRAMIEDFGTSQNITALKFARIYYRTDETDDWTVVHWGILSGLGPAANETDSKFWVYDVATYLDNIPVSLTLAPETSGSAFQTVANEVNERTPFPIVGALSGFGEEEFYEEWASQIGNFDFQDESPETTTQFPESDQFFEQTSRSGTTTFRENRDTLKDVLDWIVGVDGGVWYFEPAETGVVLVIDIGISRQTFVQEEVRGEIPEILSIFPDHLTEPLRQSGETVSVWRNNALYEINPMNTVRLRGATSTSQKGEETLGDDIEGIFGATLGLDTDVSRVFPQAVVQVPTLVQAAENTELAPKTVEDDDATTLDAAIQSATTRLIEELSETSEGEIMLAGAPNISPYDRLASYETCGDQVDYTPDPTLYEVETVEHIKRAGEPYKCRLSTSVYVDREMIETVDTETRMVEINE